MNHWILAGSAALLAAGCAMRTEGPRFGAETLPDLGPAPEWAGTVWINTAQPLRLEDLRGKVVALEFWTFGCVNCQHVIPALRKWYDTYAGAGLVVIGAHYPEFAFEADLENLRRAVVEDGIHYAVVQDNEGQAWRAYRNRFWPTLYLIDKWGRVRYRHIGEGAYEETEAAIQSLLAEVVVNPSSP